jgi:hypothetical protein
MRDQLELQPRFRFAKESPFLGPIFAIFFQITLKYDLKYYGLALFEFVLYYSSMEMN